MITSVTSLLHKYYATSVRKELVTADRVLFPTHHFQPSSVFPDSDQMNSKEGLYFQLSNTITEGFFGFFCPYVSFGVSSMMLLINLARCL